MNYENPPPYTGVNQPGPYPPYGQPQGGPAPYPGYPPGPVGYQPGQPGYQGYPQPGWQSGQPPAPVYMEAPKNTDCFLPLLTPRTSTTACCSCSCSFGHWFPAVLRQYRNRILKPSSWIPLREIWRFL